jgi:molecular chaperone GrpE
MNDDEIKNKTMGEGNEIEKIKVQNEEYLNNWKKERADFMNYKKEEVRRVEEFVRYANEDLILELIDILDNLELGLKHEPTELLKKLSKDFEELLKKYGVERIKIEGENFNPALHEAVEASEVPEARLMEEIRPGYTMHGKVIRPARVKIIK